MQTRKNIRLVAVAISFLLYPGLAFAQHRNETIADAGINHGGSIAMTVGKSTIQGDIENSGIICSAAMLLWSRRRRAV